MDDNDIKKIAILLDEKLEASEKRLLGAMDGRFNEFGEFLDHTLLPQLEDKADKADIDRLERRFDDFSGKVATLTTRVGNIEATPTVAHELKLKK